MKTAHREANKGCIEDLTTPIGGRICLGLGHRFGTMNVRSFIVKSDPKNHFSLMKTQHRSVFDIPRHESPKGRPATAKASAFGAARRPCLIRHISSQRSGFRLPHCFHGVRNHRSGLHCGVEPSERMWRRLPDELEDRGNHTQNTCGINRCFHRASPFLFRAGQDAVQCLIVFHNFKTPRSSRFVCWLLIVHDWLKVGCRRLVNWIQIIVMLSGAKQLWFAPRHALTT